MTLASITRFEIDPDQRDGFRKHAEKLRGIVARFGGQLLGYFLPLEGQNDVAWGLIAFDDPGSYETYRARLQADPEACEIADALKRQGVIVQEERQVVELVEGTFNRPSIVPPERQCAGTGRNSGSTYAMSGFRLRRVLDYIENNLSHELSLKEIAQVAGLSLSHCKYAFSKSIGLPVHQYIIQRRIERAKQLLAEDVLSISQVAEEAGFTHKSHLAFHTRRVYGLSPSGLRRRVSSRT